MKLLRPLALPAVLVVAALAGLGAGVKISDLALSTSPSTNTFMEIADLDASGTNKSAKILYTNLVTQSQLPDTLWYAYTNTDIEGGTTYTTASTNALYANTVGFAVNYLTNFYGDISSIISLGIYTPDPSTFASNNAAILALGDFAGQGATNINCISINYVGAGAGQNAYLTNAQDVSFYDASGQNAVISNSLRLTFKDYHSGNSSVFQDGNNSISLSGGGGQSSVFTNCQSLTLDGGGSTSFFTNSTTIQIRGAGAGSGSAFSKIVGLDLIGHDVAQQCYFTNVFGGGFYGFDSGRGSTIYDSTAVTAIGGYSGHNLNGSFTNLVIIGQSSVSPATGTHDQVILGDDMSFKTGSPGSGASPWKLGTVISNATVTLVTTNYVEVSIGGTVVKLAIVK